MQTVFTVYCGHVTASFSAISAEPVSSLVTERYTYLWTELIPVLAFIAVGVLFWWLGRGTRAQAAEAAQEPATLT